MKGFMRQRGKSWELRVFLGHDPLTGKKRYATQTVRGGKREAQRKLAEMVTEAERGLTARTTATVGELLEAWSSPSEEPGCVDNAVAESFWEGLKRECLQDRVYATRAEARRVIFRWSTGTTRKRIHTSLGDLAPSEWEQQYKQAAQSPVRQTGRSSVFENRPGAGESAVGDPRDCVADPFYTWCYVYDRTPRRCCCFPRGCGS